MEGVKPWKGSNHGRGQTITSLTRFGSTIGKLFGHVFSGRSFRTGTENADRGWQRRRLSEDSLRLCASESCPGEIVAAWRPIGGLSVDELVVVCGRPRASAQWIPVDRLLGKHGI